MIVDTRPIIFVINRLALGGAERLVVDEINELLKRGYNIHLVTLRREATESFLSKCNLPSKKFHPVVFKNLFDVNAWIRLVSLFKEIKPQTVISHLWFANTITRIAAYCVDIPRLITFEHNVYDNVKTKTQFAVDRFLQKRSTHIVAVSAVVHESLIAHGIDKERITIVPNALSLETFANTPPASLKKELSLQSDTFVFLTVGRLIPQKAHDVLIEAFAKLESGVLVIVGEGSDRKKLEILARSLGVEERVFFLGFRHDISALMKVADCFVFSSRWEGMSIVILEALAASMPIVITNFRGIESIIENEKNGLIVPVDDSLALSNSMRRVLSSSDLRARLAIDAKISAQEFTLDTHLERLLKLTL